MMSKIRMFSKYSVEKYKTKLKAMYYSKGILLIDSANYTDVTCLTITHLPGLRNQLAAPKSPFRLPCPR